MGAQTYRYKISYWFLFLFAFIACEIMVVGTLIKNLPNLLAGNSDFLDYVVVIIIVAICFPIGLLSLAIPFWAKIVLSPEGVEFHTISAIIKANWSDLSIGTIQTPSDLSKTLLCSQSDITLRNWAKCLPWDVSSGIRELGIPFSQFGFFNSRNLSASINQYAPHLKIIE
ncbi:MAG: hypothetical protein HYZ25_00125 [Chloroflexi bacterium]|nr:hypothetical protein [Chloroflexota bacterium]